MSMVERAGKDKGKSCTEWSPSVRAHAVLYWSLSIRECF